MRLRLIALLLLAAFVLSGAAVPAGERVVIELKDGSRLEGELLKKGEGVLYLLVGDQVVTVRQKNVKSMPRSDKPSQEQDVQKFGYYRTGERPVRSVSAHAEELGPAVAVVKTPSGLGTGWFCNPDGYVVTNQHVVAGERSIQVTAFRRRDDRFEKKVFKKVKLVGLEPHIDLALLHIEEEIDMEIPWLYLGDSTELEEGDKVFTIGNPMGLERSTAEGIISKTARNMKGRLYLQTTAPIAPGNSGGPLFNERGQVIGVISMGYLYFDGLGFAIPSEYVKEFLNNVEAFAFDPDNPNSGVSYLEAPVTTTDGSIRFTDSDFVKVGPGISCLTVTDINDDGIQEILFVDNNKAEIGILRRREEKVQWEPTGYEDINRMPPSEHFKRDTHAVNNNISSLAVTDLNGDGRRDILFIGDIDGLGVLEQKKDGSFRSSRSIARVDAARRQDAIEVEDFDGDGQDEIFVLGTEQFYLFEGAGESTEFPLNADFRDNIIHYRIRDVNGDDRPDVTFFARAKFYAVRLYLQGPDGSFQEEVVMPAHLSGPVRPHRSGSGEDSYLTLDKGRNRVRRLSLQQEERAQQEGRINIAPKAIPLSPGTGIAEDFELADLDGDGRSEVIVANQARNEYVLIRPGEAGFQVCRSPSPRKIDGLQAVKVEDGKAALFSTSIEERMFGVSRVEENAVSFPRPINTEGTVLTVLLDRIDGGPRSLVWVERVGNEYVVRTSPARELARKAFDSKSGSIDVESRTLRFGENAEQAASKLSKKPRRLGFADFNGDGKSDLIVHWSYSGKESLYLASESGTFRPIIADQEFLEEMEGQPLVVADVDSDGVEDVLLVRPGFVRLLKVDQKNKLYVEQQVNWDFGEVSRLIPCPGEEGRFIARAGSQARLVELDLANTRFKSLGTVDLTGLGGGRLQVADVDGNAKIDLLLLGKNALRVLFQQNRRRALASRTVFDARLDDFSYWDVRSVELDGKPEDEVLLFDSKKAIFEICRPARDGSLQSICRNRLFEKTIQQRSESGARELPRDVGVGDLDGNGAADLAFVMQDRIAIYLQESGK